MQCQAGKNEAAKSNARGAARADEATVVANCSDANRCPVYEDVEEDDAVALPPTSIAGASLTCLKAADPTFLACQVQNETKRIRVPSTAVLDWSVASGSDAVPTTAKVHDGLAAGSYFYVKMPTLDVASVSLKVQEGEATDTVSFAISQLPSEDTTLTLAAMPVDEIPPSSIESTGSFELDETLGNGVLSDENDGCLGQADGQVASQTVSKDINYADDAGKVSFYADDICGLQNGSVQMTLVPEAPAKRVVVKLVPYAKKLLMFKSVDLVPGPMAFTFSYIGSSQNDDVRLGSFTFVHP
jgi:hypothetical protein